MGYTYRCDGCGQAGSTPALMAQFREDWWLSTPIADHLSQHGFELGDTVTLCGDCTQNLLTDD